MTQKRILSCFIQISILNKKDITMIGINAANREIPKSIQSLSCKIAEVATLSSEKVKGVSTQINLTVADEFKKQAVITSSYSDGQTKKSVISLNPTSFFKSILASIDHSNGEVIIASKPKFMPGFIANKKILEMIENVKINLASLNPLPDGKNALVHATATLEK